MTLLQSHSTDYSILTRTAKLRSIKENPGAPTISCKDEHGETGELGKEAAPDEFGE